MTDTPDDIPDLNLAADLEIDEEELENAGNERGKVLDISAELRLLAKQNRLCLFKKKAARRKAPSGNWLAEAELQFQSLAHPECQFTEAFVAVSLEFTPGAKVITIQPERAMMHQLKVSEAHKPSLEAEILGIGIKASLGGEKTYGQTFYQPVVTGYTDEIRAIWTFRVPAKEYELNLNLPLQLAMEYPENANALRASIQVSARVTVRGWTDFIPLVGKKSGEGQSLVYLDR